MGSPLVEIHAHATNNLRVIREAMERTATFTAVPGWGGVLVGLIGLMAAVTAQLLDRSHWLEVWLAAGMLSIAAGSGAVLEKARRLKLPLDAPATRKFVFAFAPPLLVGGLLSFALWTQGARGVVPGTWLLMYGTAVAAGGAFSVRLVPFMGFAFQALGGVALFLPFAWANVALGVGFGFMHVVFGILIARKHGG